ncbi:MAG: alpha/beta hydrolase [Planctomycetota bacterium]
METLTDVAYAPEHGREGMLDIHRPEAAENTPIVMVVHGGGLQALSKERMRNVCTFLVERGWAAVNVNYRLLPDSPFPAPLADVLDAFRWVREAEREELAGLDRRRVAAVGASAGGYLVAMMGLLLGADKLRAVVDISGPSTRRRTEQVADGCDRRWFEPPIQLVHGDAPPFLCVHSRRDGVVDFSESERLVAALRTAGARAELHAYDGPDELHGIWTEQEAAMPRLLPELEDRIAAFLETNL